MDTTQPYRNGLGRRKDWGVVYHLEDTNTRENRVVSTRTANRKAGTSSVSDIWKGAEFNEREVYDYYGIRFIGHPGYAPFVPA